jgi:hypothetical protein
MKKHAAPIIATLLLLLPVLYVVSYLALVEPGPRFGWGSAVYPTYRVADGFCTRIFWPLEQLDRKLRPGAWKLEEDPFWLTESYGHR